MDSGWRSSVGLYYFDRRTEQFTFFFQHVESNPNGLDGNAVRNLSGWAACCGRELGMGGLIISISAQEQFGRYTGIGPRITIVSRAAAVTSIYRGS